MSESETESEHSAWTTANLQQLFAAMKNRISDKDRDCLYYKGLKSLQWETVAFPPFSASECEEKWMGILRKMRKIRSLTELIVEAEGTISNPNQMTHPEAPKKLPANCIFVKENFAKFHEENPEMPNKKLFKVLNEKFKELSNKEKATYQEKSHCATAKYNKRMEELRKENNQPSKRRKRQGQKQNEDEDSLPAKPPSSGYSLFCMEQRSPVRVLAQRWREMTEIRKKEYSTRCTEMKIQYAVRLNEHLKTLNCKDRQEIAKKHQIKEAKRFPGEPEIPFRASNAIFLKEEMNRLKEEIPHLRERFLKVSEMWTNLSKKDKEKYKQMVKEGELKYQKELQKWFQNVKPEHQAVYLKLNPSKRKYLSRKTKCQQPKEALHIPSDSEDEDIDCSSDEEEEEDDVVLESEEDGEQEEQEEGFIFEMY